MLKRPESEQQNRGVKRPREDDKDDDDEEAHDEVRLWEDGFKDRYYESKFDVGAGNLEFRFVEKIKYLTLVVLN